MKKHLLLTIGIGLLILSFLSALILDLPTIGGSSISFDGNYGTHEDTLKGTYWEVQNAEYAVLICPGYSCDRQKWRPMADLLVSNGLTTMVFDYSGQGASTGTIGFDNAKTDKIPEQIDQALEELHTLSGIAYDHIILLGHSMGGRAILRLLYDYNDPAAETSVTKKELCSAILLSPEVNYAYNAQASLFAGTSDSDDSLWANYQGSCIGTTSIYLFGSTADDIVSDEDILAIYAHLSDGLDTEAPSEGRYRQTVTNQNGTEISVGVVSGVLHSYEMYSPQFASLVNSAVTSITGIQANYPSGMFALVYLAWFSGLVGIGLTLSALLGSRKRKADFPGMQEEVTDTVPELVNARSFLIRKALMWIPGILAAFLFCCICVVMPFGSPVMNTPYMCFIAGYGFVMLFAYRKGRFRGTSGKLPKFSLKVAVPVDNGKKQTKRLIAGIVIAAGLCLLVWFVLRATMYRLIPLNARLFWVAFAAVVMTIGYYVSGCESDMLEKANASWKVKLVYNLIQYVPLLLLVLFYMVLKSYSGMIGQIQNMVLMYIFCVPIGTFLRKLTQNRLIGALVTGFLFQTLMITSAALIALF